MIARKHIIWVSVYPISVSDIVEPLKEDHCDERPPPTFPLPSPHHHNLPPSSLLN